MGIKQNTNNYYCLTNGGYQHNPLEEDQIKFWAQQKVFSNQHKNPAFTIVIPPPNVTGALHLGHAWDNTLQDCFIRYHALQGRSVRWLQAMDHAGIATQNKVESMLNIKGQHDRAIMGRSKLVAKINEFNIAAQANIKVQWSKLGLSLDQSKHFFTLDPEFQTAVNEAFIKLYKANLIYQGKRVVAWDPLLQTALSDIEVTSEPKQQKLYYLKYQVVDDDQTIIIATTRPETMFADVAIFLNPQDLRLSSLAGKSVINPANGELLPILTDKNVDQSFGTGIMKCTPAHDYLDFELGKKHNLAQPHCLNGDGTMNERAGQWEGQDRYVCRKNLIAWFQEHNIVAKITDHVSNIGYSSRSGAVIEPMLSTQWFVKMKPLIDTVLNAQKKALKTQFYPDRFETALQKWCSKIEDWCISRQIWWGHQMPVWYHKHTNEIFVGTKTPDGKLYIQDPDVLDTWFSSALWPLVASGWPDHQPCLQLPVSLMIAGYDILFFWIMRMMTQTWFLDKQAPFSKVLIHGLIRDATGRKMSKSLGNGIEPLQVIKEKGNDALRLFFLNHVAYDQDLKYQTAKIEKERLFLNKLWNAGKYCAMHIPKKMWSQEKLVAVLSKTEHQLYPWIWNYLLKVTKTVNHFMENINPGLALTELNRFFWQQFCSLFIELSKSLDSELNQQVIAHVFKQILRLYHPFIPFITEALHRSLYAGESVYDNPEPELLAGARPLASFTMIISLIKILRQWRLEQGWPNNRELIFGGNFTNIVNKAANFDLSSTIIRYQAAFKKIINATYVVDLHEQKIDFGFISTPLAMVVYDQSVVKVDDELQLQKQKLKLTQEIKRSESILNNKQFIAKAKPAKIASEKAKYNRYLQEYESILKTLSKFKNKTN